MIVFQTRFHLMQDSFIETNKRSVRRLLVVYKIYCFYMRIKSILLNILKLKTEVIKKNVWATYNGKVK